MAGPAGTHLILAEEVHISGVLPDFALKRLDPLDAPTVAYGAAQPNTIRTALATIPSHAT